MLENRILIVDDDPSWQELLRESIEAVEGLGPILLRVAGSRVEADALLDRQHFHLAFVDLRLHEDRRELEGKEIVRKIVGQDEGTAVVIATGHADVSTAITALREWKVLDFILKDAWDPDKVAALMRVGLPAARAAYQHRYESAIELLRGEQAILPWMAAVLECMAVTTSVTRPDRALGDFLNALLDGFYPLLPERGQRGVALDCALGLARARFWSKALGGPMAVCFGRRESVEAETAGLTRGSAFTRVERTVCEERLGMAGVVYVPVLPPFEAFGAA